MAIANQRNVAETEDRTKALEQKYKLAMEDWKDRPRESLMRRGSSFEFKGLPHGELSSVDLPLDAPALWKKVLYHTVPKFQGTSKFQFQGTSHAPSDARTGRNFTTWSLTSRS